MLIRAYLSHSAPRPPLIHLPNLSSPTVVLSLLHSGLLFLATTTLDSEPLIVLEFLHRIVDALEEFLGAPLLETKIENGYDIVAQLLAEMCDAGQVSTTELNALRDLVEVPGWMGKLLGGVGLPGYLLVAIMLTPLFISCVDEGRSIYSADINATDHPWLHPRSVLPSLDNPRLHQL